MSGAQGTKEGKEKYMQGFGGETWGKDAISNTYEQIG
jgi:hypothetical protein